jgi:hypothetical protein
MNIQQTADPFALLWALGYHNLIPIVPPGAPLSPASSLAKRLAAGDDARGKAPGVKGADGLWRGLDFPHYVADERDLTRWRAWGAGVGIVCRDGLRAIDVDTLDEGLAKRFVAEIEATLGRLPARIGRYPKTLFPIRVEGESPYRMFEFGPAQKKRERIEVLADGKQFVAHGVHPGTHEPYRWPRSLVAWDDLSVVPAATLAALIDRLRTMAPQSGPLAVSGVATVVDQATLRGDPEILKLAIAATPNTHNMFPTRESYRDYGYAIKAAFADEEEGLSQFQGWCEGWRSPTGEINDPGIVAADWRRMKPPFRIGASRLYALAKEASNGAFDGRALELRKKFNEDPPEPEPPPEPSIFPEEPPYEPALDLLGTPYRFPKPSEIAPREFLYGDHYQRQYASVTIAPTKVGKSSLGIVEALAMASGKPLLGVKPEGLFRVRIWNGEDPIEEMERRIVAAMQHYGLSEVDIGDRLLVDSGRQQPIAIARQMRDGAKVWEPVVLNLRKSIETQRVDCLIVDPFVKSHSVSENDNMAIDVVVGEWSRLAGATRVALELVHHSRKTNGAEASIDDARGASALVSAARAARVLTRMTKREAEKLGLLKKYKRLFRFADAASNMTAPVDDEDRWMEIASIDLRNAQFDEAGAITRKSDMVGVVRVFDMATVATGSTGSDEEAREETCLAEMASGDWRRDHRAGDAWAGVLIARVFGLDLDDPDHKARAKAMITRWLREGRLIEVTRRDKHRNPHSYLEIVKAAPDDLFG